jgi:hypothetical protein
VLPPPGDGGLDKVGRGWTSLDNRWGRSTCGRGLKKTKGEGWEIENGRRSGLPHEGNEEDNGGTSYPLEVVNPCGGLILLGILSGQVVREGVSRGNAECGAQNAEGGNLVIWCDGNGRGDLENMFGGAKIFLVTAGYRGLPWVTGSGTKGPKGPRTKGPWEQDGVKRRQPVRTSVNTGDR